MARTEHADDRNFMNLLNYIIGPLPALPTTEALPKQDALPCHAGRPGVLYGSLTFIPMYRTSSF